MMRGISIFRYIKCILWEKFVCISYDFEDNFCFVVKNNMTLFGFIIIVKL